MPQGALLAHIHMIPVLTAQENLDTYLAVGCGANQFDKRSRERILGRWRRAASMSGGPTARRPASVDELRMGLAAMGIPVIMRKKNG